MKDSKKDASKDELVAPVVHESWHESFSAFSKDYRRYQDGDVRMPFSELRLSLGAFIEACNELVDAKSPQQPEASNAGERGTIPVTAEGLRSLAGIARVNGKTEEFFQVALEWADKANAEVARLRAALASKPAVEQKAAIAVQQQFLRDAIAILRTENYDKQQVINLISLGMHHE